MPKIEISEYNNNLFLKSDYGSQKSLTETVNWLVEKLAKDELVILDDVNCVVIKDCAAQIQRNSSFVVNDLLHKIEPDPETEVKKIKIKVGPVQEKVNIKLKQSNKITNWG